MVQHKIPLHWKVYSPKSNGTCTPGVLPLLPSFKADIDEFRVYSRELPVDDVCAFYRD